MDIYEQINQAKREEIKEILDAVLFRHKELYPQWELSVISIEIAADKNEQLDRIIQMLRDMK